MPFQARIAVAKSNALRHARHNAGATHRLVAQMFPTTVPDGRMILQDEIVLPGTGVKTQDLNDVTWAYVSIPRSTHGHRGDMLQVRAFRPFDPRRPAALKNLAEGSDFQYRRIDPNQLRDILRAGAVVKFSMVGNPVKRDHTGRSSALYGAKAVAWLERKMRDAGADVLRVDRFGPPYGTDECWQPRVYERNDDNGNRQPFAMPPIYCVQFSGILQVVDPLRLVDAYATSKRLGKGGAFGCCQLQIAPYAGSHQTER